MPIQKQLIAEIVHHYFLKLDGNAEIVHYYLPKLDGNAEIVHYYLPKLNGNAEIVHYYFLKLKIVLPKLFIQFAENVPFMPEYV